jgi:hypothetical protein
MTSASSQEYAGHFEFMRAPPGEGDENLFSFFVSTAVAVLFP